MNKSYKRFIDGLVEISESTSSQRVLRGFWHPEPPPDQRVFNDLVTSLSEEQKRALAQILQEERTGGIHDALCFIQDQEYVISDRESSFQGSPFDTELYYDYAARLSGEPWPS